MKRQNILLLVLVLAGIAFAATFVMSGAVQLPFMAQANDNHELVQKAEQGDAVAQFQLGNQYRMSGTPDYAKALEWYKKAAAQGNVEAENNIGTMYYRGQLGPQNVPEAIKWFKMAADGGQVLAQDNLGNLYFDGNGVPQDTAQAVVWYQKAAEQGNVDAEKSLGIDIFLKGSGSVPKDYGQAMKWLLKASTQGDADSEAFAGWMYLAGIGAVPNKVDGLKLLLKSAESKNKKALAFLGKMAEASYNEPANHGIMVAESVLASIYVSGNGTPQDFNEAFKWAQKAAEWGDAKQEGLLGSLYGSGSGTPVSYVQAYKWMSLAAAQNLPKAVHDLAVVKAVMSPEQIAQGDQLVRSFVPKQMQ